MKKQNLTWKVLLVLSVLVLLSTILVVNAFAQTTSVSTTEELQAALNNAGEGAVIELASGDYGVVYLQNNGADSNRIMKDVTIKAATGATVNIAQIKYNPVSGKSLDIENLTIDGLNFNVPEKTAVLFDENGGYLRVNGLTIQNCVKVGNNSQGTTYDNAAFIGGYYDGSTAMNATFNGDTTLTRGYHDIKILNNTITNVFQPIKFPISGPLYGLTVTGNTFTGCTDNHFMLSTKTSGAVVISNNTITNMTGRLARIAGAEANATFTISNNTVVNPFKYDTGDDGSIVKITGTTGFTVSETGNNWTASTVNGGTYISSGDTTLLAIAKIGDVYYTTASDFKTAFSAISGTTTVTIFNNIDLGSDYLNVNSGKVITLELNGKTLTSSSSNGCIKISSGNLTVNDTVGSGKVINTYNGGCGAIYVGGSNSILNINAGYFEGVQCGVYYYYGGTFAINGGTFKGGTNSVKVYDSSAKLTINDGYFIGTPLLSLGTMTINGGYFTKTPSGDYTVLVGKDILSTQMIVGDVTYNYALGTLTEENSEAKIGSNLYVTIGQAINAAQANDTIVLLKDCTAKVSISKAVIFTGDYLLSTSLTISNGTFNCGVNSTGAISGGTFNNTLEAADGKISGGVFAIAPTSSKMVEHYILVEYGTKYKAKLNPADCEATIGENEYLKISDAINAATAGVTVKLMKDITGNYDFYRYDGPCFTLDLNGHSIITETGKALSVAGFNLQITDSIGTGIVKGEIALYVGGSSSNVKETITIKGGTFEGSEYAVYLEGYSVSNTANIIIENGYFKGSFKSYRNSSDTGVYFKGLATFKGGNYTENLNSFAKCSNPTSTSYWTGGFAYFPTGYSVVEDELAEYRYKVQEVTYEVSIGSFEHGSILINGKTSFDIKAGTKVTITSTPDADYKLKTYKVNGVAIDGDTFNVTEDSVVTAEFIAKEYIIQNTTTGAKYETITEAAEAAQSGDTIKLLRSCSFDKSQGLTNEAWHWDHTFENITLDLNNKTLYLTGSAQLKVAGKNILIKRGTINSTHNYAIETDQYNPTVDTVEASTITLDNVIMNAGVNCQATQLNVHDCNIDATNKKYYAFYLSSGCKPNNITIESGKYTAGTQVVFSLENNSQIVKLSGGLYGSQPTDAMLATGFAVMTNKDDSTSTKYPYKVSKYIVEIVETSVKYDHVGEALDAALDGQTVRLLSDTTLYGLVDSTFTDDKTVTFDLNGKVWKLNTETQAWQHAIRLTGTGTLIVKDSSQAKTGAMIYDSEYGSCKMFTVNVNSNVNIVIESGTFTTTGSGTTIECGGDLTIYDGTITGVSCSGNFTMLGGTIGRLSMFSASGKNATIRGGTIEHSFTLPYSGDGVNVFISGGTIGNISNQNDDGINNSVVITGGNITWLQPGGTTLITGGTFTNLNGGHFTIEGGNFTNLFFHNITEEEWLADPNALSYRDSTYCITGGTFATTNYIVDKTARTIESDIDGRYFASKKANGLWVVELKDTVTVVTNPDGNKEVTVEVNYGETTVSAGSTGATTSGTNVSGVELSKNKTVENDTKTGLQQVIENAKTKAGATSNFTKAVEADTNKIIDVEVKVKVTVNQMVVEIANKTIVYDVTPSATVKVITINNDTETVEEVKEVTVTNEMINQKQDIVVELYSDFAPVQIIHKDDDGKIIGVYNQGDFTYDETTHLVKVIVHHFSTLTLVGSDNEKANAVAEIKGGAQYDSLDAALAEAKKTQDSVVIKLLTDIHYSGEKILVIQSNVALNLNGFSITGLDDITVNGKVVDTSPAKGVLSAQSYTFDKTNCVYTPIYDNAHSGYSFFRLSIKSVITREKENDDGLNVQFALKKNSTYTVERNAALELLAKSSSRVKATITISWGDKTVSYPFSQGEMAEFCNITTAKAFSAHIVGLNAIEAGTVLKITVSLKTYNADGVTDICSLESDLYATSSKTNAQVTFANEETGIKYDVNTPPTFNISKGAKYTVQYICGDADITVDDNYTAPVVNGKGWQVVVTVLEDDNYNAGVFKSKWFRPVYTPVITFSNTEVGKHLTSIPTYTITPASNEIGSGFTNYTVTVTFDSEEGNVANANEPYNNGKGWTMKVKISESNYNLQVTEISKWFFYEPETN